MKAVFITVLFVLGASGLSSPKPPLKFHDPHFFPNRSVIVHLHEWTYESIARECEDFLGPNGYGGVQISPASENLVLPGRPWYERYQPISYEINTRSGNVTDFIEMTSRCQESGVRIYVDVVPNHMSGNIPNAMGTAGTFAVANDFFYPGVPYWQSDFHWPPCAINNFDDPVEARNCELLGLHDLDQSVPRVRWAIINFLDRLTALGAAGFRVDAAKHMWPEDLQYIYDHVSDLPMYFGFRNNSQPFIFQEVGDSWKFNYSSLGAVTEFDHAYNMASFFKNMKPASDFKNYGGPKMGMLPTESALVFVDNHDLQRQNSFTLNYKNPREFKAAYAFTLAHPYGIPRVMSSFHFVSDSQGPPHDINDDIVPAKFNKIGQCNNGWVCEHRWPEIVNMVKFRNSVRDSPLTNWKTYGNSTLSFSRGNKGFIMISSGQMDFDGIVATGLPQGVYCNAMRSSSQSCPFSSRVAVDNNGHATIQLRKESSQLAIALHVGSMIGQH